MFRSVDHAIRWASQVSSIPVVKGSSVFGMMAGGGKVEMSALDKRGQAALIWSLVDRTLDSEVVGRAYVMARYCHALDCRDVIVRAELREEQRSRVMMSNAVAEALTVAVIAALPTGMHSRRGYAGLVRSYFGQPIGMHSLRADLKCRLSAIPEYRKQAYDALDRIGTGVSARLEEAMLEHGLLDVDFT